MIEHPAKHRGLQLGGRVGVAGHHERNLVAEPPLELPDHPIGFGRCTSLRIFADHQRSVFGHQDDGGCRDLPAAELQHLRSCVLDVRRSCESRAEIDAQSVAHASPRGQTRGRDRAVILASTSVPARRGQRAGGRSLEGSQHGCVGRGGGRSQMTCWRVEDPQAGISSSSSVPSRCTKRPCTGSSSSSGVSPSRCTNRPWTGSS